MSESDVITVIVVGCGSRGEVYSSYTLKHPERAKLIGIADPRAHARKKFQEIYKSTLNSNYVFSDWRDFIALDEKVAQCVIIALPDKLHKDAAVEFTKKGYHMLIEKPMATSLDECKQITITSRARINQINAVSHVLRYLGPCIKLKQLIDSGIIGDVVNINHTEPVGYYHFAHSFVRGNWHKEADSTFSLLAKCCHDVDLIIYWMGEKKKCTKVSSFGSLKHFRKENAPKNATDRCLTCPHEPDCCYSAKKLYLDSNISPSNWPCSVVLSSEINNLDEEYNNDIEDFFMKKSESEKKLLLEKCLANEKTKYGRCAYKMDNDVCDNQVVNFLFDDNSTATMTMIAFTQDICSRKTKIYGTKGQLEWDDALKHNKIQHYDFLTGKSELIDCIDAIPTFKKQTNDQSVNSSHFKLTGHGGSDYFMMDSFIEAVLKNDKSFVLTDIEDSFRSHLIVFAAEYSRLTNKIIDIKEFCELNNINI